MEMRMHARRCLCSKLLEYTEHMQSSLVPRPGPAMHGGERVIDKSLPKCPLILYLPFNETDIYN